MSSKTRFRSVYTRTALGCSLAAIISFSSIIPAQAFFFLADPKVKAEFDHFFECKHLLFTNPKKHAEMCLPNNVKVEFGSIETLHSIGAPSAPPPPPPPAVQEEKKVEPPKIEEETDCSRQGEGGECLDDEGPK